MILTTLIIIVALALDWLIGEPKRWHPLVGFGWLVMRMERCLHQSAVSNNQQIIRGFIAVLLLLIPISFLSYFIAEIDAVSTLFSILVLTLCLGHKSLHDHALPIAEALESDDLEQARYHTSRIVSRDPATLNIPRAAIESVLENGADSVFSALFWFLIGGVPAVIFYRLANTLDAMWGYRNIRYLYFGRFAARLDDVLNYIPARLTALSYALVGNTKLALRAWRQQARLWDSPNAGPVMAAGAGALNITLGGDAQYDGKWHHRILLGYGDSPEAVDIYKALTLLRHSVYLWLVALLLLSGLYYA
ncbi:MAG: cobalamin biosynthesis protein [Piscirickettsiaceae bacterium]|nr:cobalamin biosynthesis protein [Piscirickettsiaceae bacterium]